MNLTTGIHFFTAGMESVQLEFKVSFNEEEYNRNFNKGTWNLVEFKARRTPQVNRIKICLGKKIELNKTRFKIILLTY